MADEIRLPPCPFCETPNDNGEMPYPLDRSRMHWAIHCLNDQCEAEVVGDTEADVIARWSRRPAPQSVAVYATCPFTNRPHFMDIEHPELGMVPTYGGPFDSYTIPIPDNDDERALRSERFDHDAGHWVEGGEPLPLHVITANEFVELCDRAPPSDGRVPAHYAFLIQRTQDREPWATIFTSAERAEEYPGRASHVVPVHFTLLKKHPA